MVDVAKALGRPATYPTKFFGCELGAQTQFDFKNDRYIVNGAHDAAKLQQMLDGFIKKFVLCTNCENPETTLLVNARKGTIGQSCKACGHLGQLDMRHKLTTFILKNPPEVNPAAQGASLTEGKKARRKKGGDEGGRTGSPKNGSEGSDDNDWGELDSTHVDEDDWAVDVSEEAVKARMEDLSSGAKGLAISDDLEKTPKERADVFYNFVKRRRDDGSLPHSVKDIAQEAERLDVKDKGPLILCELLFNGDLLNQLKTHRVLLLRFTHENVKAQKALLGGIELTIQLNTKELLPKVAHILKTLYDTDIIEEEVILDWASKPSKKYVGKELSAEIHAKADPFIKWLKEAEEEESDSEDEESDVEIEYDDRARPTSLKEQVKSAAINKPAPVKAIAEEGDDIDIDDI
uniref:Eukaryotic translation initiation factor 5 n=1 Tax=Lynceus sp. MCZ IZ 141354 TaxID=1930659 RepID=A0A9N6WU05_9CRUS|nr:EOG090X05QT [Lynceus sp. MCZ IZ 141354]